MKSRLSVAVALLLLCLVAWSSCPTPQIALSAEASGVLSASQVNYVYDSVDRCSIHRKTGVAAGGAPGTDTIIAGVAGKKFRILSMGLFATSTTSNEVHLTHGSSNLWGNSGNGIVLDIDGIDGPAGFVLPWNPGGWMQTGADNEAIVLNTTTAQDIIYTVTYIEVD